MKLRSAPILGFVSFCVSLAMMDVKCDYKDVLGGGLLDALWFAGATRHADQGDQELQDQIDGLQDQVDQLNQDVQEGLERPGVPGTSCWDLNGNGRNDPAEDTNGDGVWDALDCQGAPGAAGQNGSNGANGLSCWDLNGNGQPDPSEDVNGDGVWDARDCQGAPGAPGQNGANGTNGLSCWDLNGNGRPDPAEDVNRDGVFDARDCQGAQGPAGQNGSSGGNCWDDIGDFNGDGQLNSYDCLDYVAAGGDDAVIARGFIDGFGQIVRATNILTAAWINVGVYEIVIDLSHSGLNLNDPLLQANHFPVLLTVYATSSSPLPWGGSIGALVGHYRFDPATALDRTNQRLTVRIYILDTQNAVPVSAGFSIMVLRP